MIHRYTESCCATLAALAGTFFLFVNPQSCCVTEAFVNIELKRKWKGNFPNIENQKQSVSKVNMWGIGKRSQNYNDGTVYYQLLHDVLLLQLLQLQNAQIGPKWRKKKCHVSLERDCKLLFLRLYLLNIRGGQSFSLLNLMAVVYFLSILVNNDEANQPPWILRSGLEFSLFFVVVVVVF